MINEDKQAQSVLSKLNSQLSYSYYDTTIHGQEYDVACFVDYIINKGYSKSQMNNIVCLLQKCLQDKSPLSIG